MNSFPQTLTLAGTDSGGGAGIMADLKTMEARHVFGTAVVVAVTAQNTLGVQKSLMLPIDMINAQCASLAADFQIKACKTGMLGDKEHVLAVANNLRQYDFGPLTVDPVMVAKGGAILLEEDAIKTMITELFPLATILTPNLLEAEKIVGQTIDTPSDFKRAAQMMQQMGAKNIVIKGGHKVGEKVQDYVLLANGHEQWLSAPRIDTKRTHGTGDTLSACITAELAKGHSIIQALQIAKNYISQAIAQTIQVGHGHGPLNHWAGQELS
ncbi:bifunctional hydroxymethylpyrimidine kinase/phosphomethylpyrimidine kinase [Bombilactobacillus folatiphilus]|uniref:Hydroxymethylpyrimidine/phosphomethylpyrimidine kinase n=1 Tax=Bombilactobacillus folatiphilus TaxID=2923362 RepID=A0ABY4PBJ5_9LACO|nr:bifunctional hydroxymethylpyrimidine kinase/phosphomethylpyrimidine kinase [Bombilactobacillus folatiphilus]UQS82929.1 bifunctional hydroxymethylpyrimidine kinase/phosphomethylpyrimidine kinase [Bombilactobacillus folatiphilus]